MENNNRVPIEDLKDVMFNYYYEMRKSAGGEINEKEIWEIVDRELADYLGCLKNIDFWNSRLK